MSRAGSSCGSFHGLLVIVVAGWAGLQMSGAVEGAASKREETGEPMASAKRDFRAVRASGDAGVGEKEGLPRLDVLSLNVVTPNHVERGRPPKNEAEQKPANWLLDAMEKSSSARKDRELARASPEPGGKISGSRPARGVDPFALKDELSEADRGVDSSAVAPNPLAHYLGRWLTPQDYGLLQLGRLQKNAGLGAGATRSGGEPAAVKSSGVVAPLNSISWEPLTHPRFSERSGQRANPYLASIEGAPTTSLATPAVNQGGVGVPPVSAIAPAAVPAAPGPSTSRLPDFARPVSDEKYFKPLKRF
ncbi:MAG: hypothetical protein RL077_4132 [Verrucomicrobiota bacterium]